MRARATLNSASVAAVNTQRKKPGTGLRMLTPAKVLKLCNNGVTVVMQWCSNGDYDDSENGNGDNDGDDDDGDLV
jgi:hypothetical protein